MPKITIRRRNCIEGDWMCPDLGFWNLTLIKEEITYLVSWLRS